MNNELVCDCGHYYNKTDKHLCSLKPICGEGSDGRKDCDRRNKLCFVDSNEKGYFCAGFDRKDRNRCLPGMFDDNGFCIDNCTARRREDCSRYNGYCDSSLSHPKNDTETIGDYCRCRPGFVQRGSGSSFRCVAGKYTVQFSLIIKNTILENQTSIHLIEQQNDSDFSADLIGYYKEIQIAHDVNLDRMRKFAEKSEEFTRNRIILGYAKRLIEKTNDYHKLKDDLKIQRCDKNENYFNCLFTLTLNKKQSEYPEQLNEQLSTLCVPFENSQECFFPFINQSAVSSYYQTESHTEINPTIEIVANKDELDKNKPVVYKVIFKLKLILNRNKNFIKIFIIHSFKTCKESAKQHYSNCEVNSNCVDSADPDSSLFKCVCDTTFYEERGVEYFETDEAEKTNINDTIREHCISKKRPCSIFSLISYDS